MSTDLDSPRSPRGRGDGSHPAAPAEQSADIADMMAMRAESHAGRAGEWASDAKRYADMAKIRSSTCAATATVLWERHAIVAFVMIALGVVLGFALSVLSYVAVVRIVHDTVGSTEQRTV